MAGDWMKIEKDTPEKPEIAELCTALGITPESAFAKCFKIWRWADSNTVDGRVRRVAFDFLDSLTGLPGFAQALVDVGWLRVRSDCLELPNFDRHMGQPAKARALAADRKRNQRHAQCHAPVTLRAGPEKRREEKSKEEPPKPPFGSEAFRTAWGDWVQHRHEKGVKLTPMAIRKQFKFMAEIGEARAIAAIEWSIAQSYQGIFEPSGKAKPPPAVRKVESKDETSRKLAEMREYERKAMQDIINGNGVPLFKPVGME